MSHIYVTSNGAKIGTDEILYRESRVIGSLGGNERL